MLRQAVGVSTYGHVLCDKGDAGIVYVAKLPKAQTFVIFSHMIHALRQAWH